ncbi:Macrophage erythroblast attacher isoform 1 [Mycena indigotica]|uniref:Macrophage erythroblast attacher isoform 1 n=1 Tax=Mycena indigotica TaxID=2126181 RepID=A0A8H6S2C1_9AGAR|nr:Macrophage erythroblast attacher isoform 1 [Mycena indigotica]KAF7290562.1 Macrophage erythroblast attacher isoform 1 [Mycena indigotica]
MSFAHAAPPSPTSSASSASSGPRTPDSSPSVAYPPRLALPVLPDFEARANPDLSDDGNAGGVKRTLKMKQRISTAERRASHNAVERQRREALNSRFLDLAGVLPNLATVRRPSKSSIVNSSIAYIHASRRHRITAAQQLRQIASECEALRREANEWRARAGVMRLDTPSRGESFSMVLGEELHYEVGDLQGVYEDEEAEEYAMAGYQDEMMRLQMLQQQSTSPFAHNVPTPPHSAPLPPQGYVYTMPRRAASHSPVIASPTSYDNYDHQLQMQQLMIQQQQQQEADEKWVYTQQMMHAQEALDTQQQQSSAGVW